MLQRDIRDYLEMLVQKYPSIGAIWLVGSRAAGCSRAESDWDFFVFADNNTFQAIKRDPTLHRDDIDLLVVLDGNSFEEPWGDDPKRGTLKKWRWSKVSENEAKYVQTKWVADEDATKRHNAKHNRELGELGKFIDSEGKGILTWSDSKGFVL